MKMRIMIHMQSLLTLSEPAASPCQRVAGLLCAKAASSPRLCGVHRGVESLSVQPSQVRSRPPNQCGNHKDGIERGALRPDGLPMHSLDVFTVKLRQGQDID
jgi:hypothetical protein